MTISDMTNYTNQTYPMQVQFHNEHFKKIDHIFGQYISENFLKVKITAKIQPFYNKIFIEPALLVSHEPLSPSLSFKQHIKQKNYQLFQFDYRGIATRNSEQTVYMPFRKEEKYFVYMIELNTHDKIPSKIKVEIIDNENNEFYFDPDTSLLNLQNCSHIKLKENFHKFGSDCQYDYQLLESNYKYHFKKSHGRWATFGVQVKPGYKYQFTMSGLGKDVAWHYNYLNSVSFDMISDPNFLENTYHTYKKDKEQNDTFTINIDKDMTKMYLKECKKLIPGTQEQYLESLHYHNNSQQDESSSIAQPIPQQTDNGYLYDNSTEESKNDLNGKKLRRNLKESINNGFTALQFSQYENVKQCMDDRILLLSFYFSKEESVGGEVLMEIRENTLKGEFLYFYIAATLGILLVILLIGGILYVYYQDKTDIDVNGVIASQNDSDLENIPSNQLQFNNSNSSNPNNNSNSSSNAMVPQAGEVIQNNPGEQPKKIVYVIVTQNTVEKYMPKRPYQDLIENFPEMCDQQECLICLNKFQPNDMCRLTICLHLFHIECVDVWIKKNGSCPYCRNKINRRVLEDTDTRKKAIQADPFLKKLIESQVNSVYSSSSDGGSCPKKKMKEFDFMYEDDKYMNPGKDSKDFAKSKFAQLKEGVDQMVDSPLVQDQNQQQQDSFNLQFNTVSPSDISHNNNNNNISNSTNNFINDCNCGTETNSNANSINNSPQINNMSDDLIVNPVNSNNIDTSYSQFFQTSENQNPTNIPNTNFSINENNNDNGQLQDVNISENKEQQQ